MTTANNTTQIIIMTALACEAKPLIDHYGLKKTTSSPFAHFCAEHAAHKIDLVVSGIGQLAMATAIGWASASLVDNGSSFKDKSVAWLNVGTAGHASRVLGQTVLVNSVVGESLSRTYYPSLVCKWGGDTESLISVNSPSSQYPEQAAVDMEGQAFFNSAIRFSSAELVQSVKVISDNAEHGLENLNAQKLSDYIFQNISEITGYVSRMLELAGQQYCLDSSALQAPDGLHFTVSQQHQWQDLKRKAVVMIEQSSIDSLLLASELNTATSAKQAIAVLASAVSCAVPRLGLN